MAEQSSPAGSSGTSSSGVSSPPTQAHQAATPPAKMGKYGLVEVNVIETRDLPVAYCTLTCEYVEHSTSVKKKTEVGAKFDEFFSLPVNRPQSILTLLTWKRQFLGKDKANGYFAVPVKDLPHAPQEKLKAEWYPVVRPQAKSPRGGVDVMAVPPPPASPTSSVAPDPKPVGEVPSASTNSAGQIVATGAETSQERERASSTSGKGKKRSKDDKGPVGYVRLQFLVKTPEPERLHVRGIALTGEWAEGSDGGNIVGNPAWYCNLQFLLTVGTQCDVTLSLTQTSQQKETQTAFYLLKYDDAAYKGRRMTVFRGTDDVVKTPGDFLSPVFAENPSQNYPKLPQGTYCVIPCTTSKTGAEADATRFHGKFIIAANTESIERIAFAPLPAEPQLQWNELHVSGEWTEQSSGGADLSAVSWQKNPQYLLTLSNNPGTVVPEAQPPAVTDAASAPQGAATSAVSSAASSPRGTIDVCVLLNQRTTARSIGIYCFKVDDTRHKTLCAKNVAGATKKCTFSHSNGVVMNGLEPGSTYVIMPCTHEAGLTGAFGLSVFTTDRQAKLSPLTTEWEHRRVAKGAWQGSTAGGSPNHETFIHNPQFALKIDPKGEGLHGFVVQLVQHRTKRSEEDLAPIGLLVLRGVEPGSTVKPGDLKPSNVVCQTDGWSAMKSVSCTGSVAEAGSLVVIPSTFDPGMIHKFSLTVYSDSEIALSSLGSDDAEASDS